MFVFYLFCLVFHHSSLHCGLSWPLSLKFLFLTSLLSFFLLFTTGFQEVWVHVQIELRQTHFYEAIILYHTIYALMKYSSSNEKNKLFKSNKKMLHDWNFIKISFCWALGKVDTMNTNTMPTKTGAREKEKKTRARKRQDMWESRRPWQKYFLNVKFMKYSQFGYVP